jgi:hypothetical protein
MLPCVGGCPMQCIGQGLGDSVGRVCHQLARKWWTSTELAACLVETVLAKGFPCALAPNVRASS